MKKKLQLLLVAFTLLVSFNVKADTIINSELNLLNPDVRKCLREASEVEGWKVESIYMNSDDNLVYVFSKENNNRVYISK